MKSITLIKFVPMMILSFTLCACPGKVDPGNPQTSNLGKASPVWGMPMIRTLTAGFNGSVSEPNDAGPANSPKVNP